MIRLRYILMIAMATAYEADDEKPSIVLENYNLIFMAARDKNITIAKNGKMSSINIIGFEFRGLFDDMEQSAKTFKNLKANFGRVEEAIFKMREFFDHNADIFKTQKNINSSESMPQEMPRNFLQSRRRLTNLETKFNNIESHLTNNKCSTTPCKNGGTCIDSYDKYICLCDKGWEGTDCSTDINECQLYQGMIYGCQNGGTCTNLPGSFYCSCASGWFGLNCNVRSQSCDSGTSSEICGHGTCIQHSNEISCLCELGWKTSGSSPQCTVDVDECSGNYHPCSTLPFVPCVNTAGSFKCGSCPAGYSGPGYYCFDIDECLENNGGCSTNPTVQCRNTIGSRVCEPCPAGFEGDGITCSYKGLCEINNGGCSPLAKCTAHPGIGPTNVRCVCSVGYFGTGVGPDGCLPVISISSNNTCSRNNCHYGACLQFIHGLKCVCDPNYTGDTCDQKIDPCLTKPCENGGSCIKDDTIVEGYRCKCTDDFTGKFCQNHIHSCTGTRFALEGNLTFPSQNYNRNKKDFYCTWTIETVEDKVMNVSFSRFDLKDSTLHGCIHDWLEIYDGKYTSYHKIGRFCGKQLKNTTMITSTHNAIVLVFQSSDLALHSGFTLHWTSVIPICGGFVENQEQGEIISPGYPGPYPQHRDCYWHIRAKPQNRIEFSLNTLDVGNRFDCNGTYLKFYDGYTDDDPELSRVCGSKFLPKITSSGRYALVHFHSKDLNISSSTQSDFSGFKFSYKEVPGFSGCGGVYKNIRGEINSPSSAGQYEMNIVCEYEITPKWNGRFIFTYKSFDIKESPNCEHAYFKIYDGSSSSPKMCGNDLPRPFVSKSNQVLIVFKSTIGTENINFKLHYEFMCFEIFNAEQGVIYSPDFPRPYPTNINCKYQIILPAKTAIILQFTDFDVGGTFDSGCHSDFLRIHDGDNVLAPVLGEYCGSDKPTQIISTFSYLFLEFYSDSSSSGTGWKLNYTTKKLECGKVIREAPGEYSFTESDHMLIPYTAVKECEWILTAPSDRIIQVNMKNFNLVDAKDNTLPCHKYLEFYEYYSSKNEKRILKRFCDSDLPPSFTSYTNTLILKFHSNGSSSASYFSFSYRFIKAPSICHETFVTSTGTFTSPGWPSESPSYQDCKWTIELGIGKRINLNFTHFNLGGTCDKNYLEIRAGVYKNAPLIGKYCENSLPQNIISSSNVLMLDLQTEYTEAGSGFYGIWKTYIGGCGGSLEDYTGTLSSPNFPESFEIGTECLWKVATSLGSSIEVVFDKIVFSQENNCNDDYVAIFDNAVTKQNLIGKFCALNETSRRVISESNHILIEFKGTNYVEGGGFLLNYNTVCNKDIYGFSGVIESPNFPNKYPPGLNCTWKINVLPGNRIKVEFSHFDLQYALNFDMKKCSDYLQLKDGTEETYSKKNKDCSFIQPQYYSSSSNVTYVNFVTDQELEDTGFRLEWKSIGCGGHLKEPSGDLVSGDKDDFMKNKQCDWILEVEEGNTVQLTIKKYKIEEWMNSNDGQSITVYEGTSKNNRKLLSLNKTILENVNYTSGGNSMLVSVVSNDVGLFFSAHFATHDLKCGGKYTAPAATIFSPNYPSNYTKNAECDWYITVEENHSLEFSLIDFDLVDSGNCSDYLNIYNDHYGENDSLILKKCGSNSKKETIVSLTNKLLVEMITGSSFTSKGFEATYKTLCGKTIRTETEGFLNPNPTTWIGNYQITTCKWTIIGSKPGDHVSLMFTHMDLYNSRPNNVTACPEQYIEVFNGESSDAPSLGRFCGTKIPHTIVSHGNSLTLILSKITMPKTLFAAHYSVLSTFCGGKLTSEEGRFASPQYPNTYPENSDCVWTLTPSPGNEVMLSFVKFNVGTDNCEMDYLEIRRESGMGKSPDVHCGDKLPNSSIYNTSIWIKFHSSEGSTGPGFLAEYSYVHGNLFEDLDHGTIASPMYPYLYSNTGLFYWRIYVNMGVTIRLLIDKISFPVYNERDCSTYLAIYDGYDNKAPLLLKKCENAATPQIISTSHIVYVEFNSNHDPKGSSFLLNWEKVDEEEDALLTITCGSNTTIVIPYNGSHILKSPGYPDGYQSMLSCTWTFKTNPESHLAFKFNDLLLEESDGCVADKVIVYSERRDKLGWNQIGSYCTKDDISKIIQSDSEMMMVEFITDSTVNASGFEALIFPVCGGNVTKIYGKLQPFKNQIESSALITGKSECVWAISMNPGKTIKFTIIIGKLPSKNGKCLEDYIMIKDGMPETSPILGLGKYCGNFSMIDFETSSNFLYVKYHYDNKTLPEKRGKFYISYYEKWNNCGNSIYLNDDFNSTVISSPNYPNIPNPYSDCIWIIRAPQGERIKVEFIDRFDLLEDDNCTKEMVAIRDGGSDVSKLIENLCGSKLPPTQKSSGNMMHIEFSTYVPDPKNGFKAKVSIDVCGGTIESDSGIIVAPSKFQLLKFSSAIECEWRLIVKKTHDIMMNLDLSMPASDKCENASLQIIEMIEANNTEYATTEKLCGANKTMKINSLTNTVFVRMKIEKYVRKNLYDFKLSFTSSISTCGGELPANQGTVESPPIFTTKRICEWTIRVNEGRRITLTALQGYKSSVNFYASVGYLMRIPVRFNTTRVVESFSNYMRIMVDISSPEGYEQFRATYTSENSSVCGPEVRSVLDPIVSFDSEFPEYECEYSLEVPMNYSDKTLLVTLSELKFYNKPSRFCSNYASVIEIKSGGRPLEQICTNSETPISFGSPFRITKLYIRKKSADLKYRIDFKIIPCGNVVNLEESDDSTIELKLPEGYVGRIDCVWFIKLPLGRTQISFTNMTLTKNECEKEDFAVKRRPMFISGYYTINDRCFGTRTPFVAMNVTMRRIQFEYHADRYYNTTSLKFKFDVPSKRICGGRAYSSLNSPNFPKSYDNNLNCLWNIVIMEGYRIKLIFYERFAVEQSPNCTKDYVEVNIFGDKNIILDEVDGVWVSKQKLCGKEIPDSYTSNSHELQVRFVSDSSITNDGFKARWEEVCGRTFVASQKIQTINNPYYQKDIMNCEYLIKVPDGQRLKLSFAIFDFKKDCESENITFTVLENDEEPVVYCKNKPPKNLSFNSDLKINYKRKSERWMLDLNFLINFHIDACGGIVNHSQVIAIKPNEHFNYRCTWNITAPIDKIISIKFRKFYVASRNCRWTGLDIYEGSDRNVANSSYRLCGYLSPQPPTIKSKTNQIIMDLDDWVRKTDVQFEAEVMFVNKCVETLFLNSSKSHEFEIENNYTSFLDCEWQVNVPDGYFVRISFTRFGVTSCLEVNKTSISKAKCNCDYFEVRDGGPYSTLISKSCGNQIPGEMASSDNQMWLKFISDATLSGSGVGAILKAKPALCGQSVLHPNRTKQFLFPPKKNINVQRGIRCVWRISNANRDTIRLTFTSVDLEPPRRDECSLDFIEIKSALQKIETSKNSRKKIQGLETQLTEDNYNYDFRNNFRYVLCGRHKESTIYVHTDGVEITLQTSNQVLTKSDGFQLEYTVTGCSENFASESGRIVINNSEEEEEICIIGIHARENHTISLYVRKISMDGDNPMFSVRDGETEWDPELNKNKDFDNKYLPYFSTGNKMRIKKNKGVWNSIQFEANYVTTDKGRGCGGAIKDHRGIIYSPLYPLPYRGKDPCEWTVITPEETLVSLKFQEFDLGPMSSCNTDYVELIDRNDESVAKYCQGDKPLDYTAQNNFVKIVQHASSNNGGPGWVITFNTKHYFEEMVD